MWKFFNIFCPLNCQLWCGFTLKIWKLPKSENIFDSNHILDRCVESKNIKRFLKKIVIRPTLFYGKEIILIFKNVSYVIYKFDVWDNNSTTLNLKNENTLITYETKTTTYFSKICSLTTSLFLCPVTCCHSVW
jgi:hypothetical protein